MLLTWRLANPLPSGAGAVIRSWRPLPGHQAEPRRPGRGRRRKWRNSAGTPLPELELGCRDPSGPDPKSCACSQNRHARPELPPLRAVRPSPVTNHRYPVLQCPEKNTTNLQYARAIFKHWKCGVYSVQTKFVSVSQCLSAELKRLKERAGVCHIPGLPIGRGSRRAPGTVAAAGQGTPGRVAAEAQAGGVAGGLPHSLGKDKHTSAA